MCNTSATPVKFLWYSITLVTSKRTRYMYAVASVLIF